jgi:hypothetical protein
MKFENLTKEQVASAKKIYTDKDLRWDDRMKELMTYFGKSERTVRNWCVKLGFKEKIDIEPKVLEKAKVKKHDKTKKKFLITSAQNATPVHKAFFANLQAYAKHIDAELLVIPYRYHNPTSMWSDNDKKEDWWATEVMEFLTLNRHNLNNRIAVLSDIKVQPTASTPLNGLEGMTGDHCSVVGHPRMELKTVPVLDDSKPKIMFTTGACTKFNYISSKAGKKAEFHHSLGCAIVEIKDEDNFFFRQISATNTGEFIDLFFHVKNGEVTKENTVEALIMGDIHVANCDKRVTDITFDNLVKKIIPKTIFIHDIIDSQSVSHHNLKDPFKLHQQEIDGTNSLQKEIDDMINWLKKVEKFNVYIVKSNHDTHIDQFLRATDWRKMSTLKNALPYMEYSTATLKGNAPNGIVPYVINKHYPKFKCLTLTDNIVIKGWVCSVHGHLGASGSRGSLAQYSRLSSKSVTGHSHTIGRVGGAVSVGTSTHLRLDYNQGHSAWINSHGIINKLGKFQHIVFFNTGKELEYTTL